MASDIPMEKEQDTENPAVSIRIYIHVAVMAIYQSKYLLLQGRGKPSASSDKEVAYQKYRRKDQKSRSARKIKF